MPAKLSKKDKAKAKAVKKEEVKKAKEEAKKVKADEKEAKVADEKKVKEAKADAKKEKKQIKMPSMAELHELKDDQLRIIIRKHPLGWEAAYQILTAR
ncbi:hypothetical protein LCGC14_3085000, partial [marine sediment metagenome]